MIAVLKKGVSEAQIESLTKWFESKGLSVHLSKGDTTTIMGLVGDTSTVDTELIEGLDTVERVTRITEPFKKANRKFHPQNTVIDVKESKIGAGGVSFIAELDPFCSGEEASDAANAAKKAGAQMLFFGAAGAKYSPYSGARDIHGIKETLNIIKKCANIPVALELTSVHDETALDAADVIAVGAANMQNFELLREIGKTDKPVILKRSLAGTLEELLVSAEHIMAGGNEKVILCERGIRTFEKYTKNTLDLSAIPVLHGLSHLPVIADISHATGDANLALPMACAAAACGADGIMLELRAKDTVSRTDAVSEEEFNEITVKAKKIREVITK